MGRNPLFAVILAGGSGTRLWPWSREQFPKQLLTVKKHSLFQETVLRLNKLIPYKNIIVVTNKDQKGPLEMQIKEIAGAERVYFLEEPCAKNTAPAIGLAAYYILNKNPDSIIAVLPSDHHIEPQNRFIQLLKKAKKTAEDYGMVTIGTKPDRPETGYGYIYCGEACNKDAFWVERFIEKPNMERAMEFVNDDKFLWNSGMFVFKVDALVEAYKMFLPKLSELLSQVNYETFNNLPEIYREIDAISIDYGIMEKSNKATVIPADIRWSDVGGWDAIYRMMPKVIHGNHIKGNVYTLDVEKSLLVADKRVVSVIGLDRIILVDTEDALLVCPHNRAQDVKKIVELLKDKDAEECKVHKTVYRPWGFYTVLEENANYKIKRVVIKPGARLGLQYHNHRSEDWVVVTGKARVTVENRVVDIEKNQSAYIPIRAKHRLDNQTDQILEIIEVQNGEYLGEDDIVRIDDDYNRANLETHEIVQKEQWREKYYEWLFSPVIDEEIRDDLKNLQDDDQIRDRFLRDLTFGTGGLRGIIGAGTSRMNKYVVRKTTQGIANYMIRHCALDSRSVVIAYDSRHMSREFAEEAGMVMSANGIKTFMFEDIRPTPELSFAIRQLNCTGGIVITASHNPSKYNGYKVYWEDGGQILPGQAEQIMEEIDQVHIFRDIKIMGKEQAQRKGLWVYLGEEMDSEYMEAVKSLSLYKGNKGKDLKIVFTPLHGTGNIPIRRILKSLGYYQVFPVDSQVQPDGWFPTVKIPNTEEFVVFDRAIESAKKVGADIILGTDPDCDRVGCVVKDEKGSYVPLNGNQTGALLLEYLLLQLQEGALLPQNGVLVKTIVTSELGRVIANSFGLETIDTLTGFKYIGEKIKEFENTGDKTFIFGYEESYGYLAGAFVRDKDAVISSMLIADMAAHYKERGLTLSQVLQQLYRKYGFYNDDLVSLSLSDSSGVGKIESLMQMFSEKMPAEIAGLKITEKRDYISGKGYDFANNQTFPLELPISWVVYYKFEDQSWICFRPSGTENKLKLYFSCNGKSQEEADAKLRGVKHTIMSLVSHVAAHEEATVA